MTTVNGENGNQSIATAQILDSSLFTVDFDPDVQNSDTAPHVSVVAVAEGGYDYYAFTVTSTTSVNFDIDNGAPDFDSFIRLYTPNEFLLTYNDNGELDPGSSNIFDSNLTVTLIPGTYYLQVGQFWLGGLEPLQDYTLHISLNSSALGGARPINGGNGRDTLFGDRLAAGDKDTIYGGNGNDRLYGLSGADTLYGGNGKDELYGGPGHDILYGDRGNDLLDGGMGSDILIGGLGNDIFQFGPHAGGDVIEDFRIGNDLISLIGGVTITGTIETDINGDFVTDTRLSLSNGGSVHLLGVSGVANWDSLLL